MKTLLKVDDVWGGYGKDVVIKGLSLSVNKGDFIGIIGPNGSGKSTLLRLLTRVLAPAKGRVELDGMNVAKMDAKEFCRKAAFVPQDTPINFSFSAMEIVLMGRIPHLKRMQTETRKDFALAEDSLALTDSLCLKDRQIDTLSAGERQRVIIAKALAQEPCLLFLDEPTSHLDIGHQIMTLNLLKKLNKEKALTVVIVLHDLNLASEYCDSIMLLDEGRVFMEGPAEKVLTYQNIESVYKTVVVVNKNPISSKPYVVLVSGDYKCARG